jgi:hypothetical protein
MLLLSSSISCRQRLCYQIAKLQHLVMRPLVSHFAIPVISTLVKKLARLFSIFAAGFFAKSIFALEVTEPAGAAQGYPADLDREAKGRLRSQQARRLPHNICFG